MYKRQTSTSNTVAFGTASVTYRVKAYDSAGLESGWKTSNTVTVTNNRAPSAVIGLDPIGHACGAKGDVYKRQVRDRVQNILKEEI